MRKVTIEITLRTGQELLDKWYPDGDVELSNEELDYTLHYDFEVVEVKINGEVTDAQCNDPILGTHHYPLAGFAGATGYEHHLSIVDEDVA